MLSIAHYSSVVSCAACPVVGALLRDDKENIPQPGFVGANYPKTKLLLVGQNPGVPKTPAQAQDDKPYTKAWRDLRDLRTTGSLKKALSKTRRVAPSWPFYQHFPWQASGLSLDDVAFCNLVRCRTHDNKGLPSLAVRECMSRHLAPWLDALAPRVVVFIGKTPHDHALPLLQARGIPADFVNRTRSPLVGQRQADRTRVAALVRRIVGKP